MNVAQPAIVIADDEDKPHSSVQNNPMFEHIAEERSRTITIIDWVSRMWYLMSITS
jgi:hypothetical protein